MTTTIKSVVSIIYRPGMQKYEVQAVADRKAAHVLLRCIMTIRKKQRN